MTVPTSSVNEMPSYFSERRSGLSRQRGEKVVDKVAIHHRAECISQRRLLAQRLNQHIPTQGTHHTAEDAQHDRHQQIAIVGFAYQPFHFGNVQSLVDQIEDKNTQPQGYDQLNDVFLT